MIPSETGTVTRNTTISMNLHVVHNHKLCKNSTSNISTVLHDYDYFTTVPQTILLEQLHGEPHEQLFQKEHK